MPNLVESIPDPKSYCRVAVFKCQKCGTEEWRHNDRGRIEEPKRCPEPSCNTQWSMSMIHNRCAFYNKQIVKMQVAERHSHNPNPRIHLDHHLGRSKCHLAMSCL